MSDIVDNCLNLELKFSCLLVNNKLILLFVIYGGNMDLKIWGKTIMTIQRYLTRVTNAIDSLISKRALASGFVNTRNLTKQNAYSVTKDIIDLSQRKINLINLNIICVNALKGIDALSSKILILKFIDGLHSSEIASLLGISDRTFFRKLNCAYSELEKWFINNHITNKFFENKCKDEGWIMEVFFRCKEENKKKKFSLDDKNFFDNIIKIIKKNNINQQIDSYNF